LGGVDVRIGVKIDHLDLYYALLMASISEQLERLRALHKEGKLGCGVEEPTRLPPNGQRERRHLAY
jgi:hypothetical protein